MSAASRGEDADEALVSATNKIKTFVYQRRVDLDPLFRDFDRLNQGRITAPQFGRGLANIGCSLAPEEVEALTKEYENMDDEVDWKRFAEEMNSIFSYSWNNKDPSAEVVDAQEFMRAVNEEKRKSLQAANVAEMSDADREHLDKIVDHLRQDAFRRRLMLHTYMRDNDRLHRGYISKDNFHRVLTSVGWVLPDESMELLYWKYCSAFSPDDVDYAAFTKDVEPYDAYATDDSDRDALTARIGGILAGKEDKLTPLDLTKKKEKKPVTLERIMRRLKTDILRRRMHMEDLFLDYDQRRTGQLLPTRFRAILNANAGFVLTEEELDILHKAFPHRKDRRMIDHAALTKELHSVYTPFDIDKDPTAEPDTFVPESDDDDDDDDGVELGLDDEVPENADELADNVLEKLRQRVHRHRVDALPFFRSYDRTRTNYITKIQFTSVLQVLFLDRVVLPDEMLALYHRFKKRDGIDYMKFYKEIGHED